jgi:hypothetical protein
VEEAESCNCLQDVRMRRVERCPPIEDRETPEFLKKRLNPPWPSVALA